jgi:hypothetical protein
MATDPAAEWVEPSARISTSRIVESALRATARAMRRARPRRAAARVAVDACARTIGSAKRGAGGAARASAHAGIWALRLARRELAPDSEPALWAAGLGTAWLVHTWTASWPHAAVAGTCVIALSTLRAMHRAQQRDAVAICEQLAELRQALRVTQALLDVEVLEGAEHLDEDCEELQTSGSRRVPQRTSRSQMG